MCGIWNKDIWVREGITYKTGFDESLLGIKAVKIHNISCLVLSATPLR